MQQDLIHWYAMRLGPIIKLTDLSAVFIGLLNLDFVIIRYEVCRLSRRRSLTGRSSRAYISNNVVWSSDNTPNLSVESWIRSSYLSNMLAISRTKKSAGHHLIVGRKNLLCCNQNDPGTNDRNSHSFSSFKWPIITRDLPCWGYEVKIICRP